MKKTYGQYNTNILKNVYIREEDAAPSVFDVLKLSKTVRPFVKLCAKTKSVSSVGKVSSINKLVSDIGKYFLQYINIKKYKHYTNVPATSYQLIHCEDSVSCMEVRAHTSLDAEYKVVDNLGTDGKVCTDVPTTTTTQLLLYQDSMVVRTQGMIGAENHM